MKIYAEHFIYALLVITKRTAKVTIKIRATYMNERLEGTSEVHLQRQNLIFGMSLHSSR